ncbi:MAG: hypothetical protein K8R59_18760 [Thermoanaerobaculales bacterium]|nr:hypothetical protein [Thermoanaerobaculales bacterium]
MRNRLGKHAVTLIAGGLCLAWLASQTVSHPTATAVVCLAAIGIFSIPPTTRRHHRSGLIGVVGIVAVLGVVLVLSISGLQGPVTIRVFVATILILGAGVPLLYALTFPIRTAGEDE